MLDFNNTILRPGIVKASFSILLGPMMGHKRLTKSQRLQKLEEAEGVIQKFSDHLEHDFAAGNIFSIADIIIFFHITWHVLIFDFNLKEKFSKVANWHRRCRNVNK